MNDENTAPRSGSRWEPDASGAPTPPPAPPTEDRDAGTDASSVAAPGRLPAGTGRSSWTTRVRGRGGVLAGAAALVLLAGVGGFAVAEVTHHPDGNTSPFGVGYQPQDAGFPALPPGAGDDDGGVEGHGYGDDGGQLGGQLGGQPGSGDDDVAQQGSSL